MISAGVPGQGNDHASDICKLALDILSKCATFVVKHKPNIRLKMRMGVNTGPCSTVIGTIEKPRFYIYGASVNIANLMEKTSEPMKIQVRKSSFQFSCHGTSALTLMSVFFFFNAYIL
jgi:class 3 adenylate cyclase